MRHAPARCAGDDPATPTAAQPSTSQPAAAVLTEAQLKRAFLTGAEAGQYVLKDNNTPAVRPEADRPECRALADMTASGTGPTPQAAAYAGRSYSAKSEAGLMVTTALLSYEGEGAQQALADVRKAVTACAGGFSTSGNNGGATIKYVSVRSEQVTAGGDESTSWLMTGEARGTRLPMHFTSVRVQNTLAVFLTLHLTDPVEAELPADLLDAQVDRVAAALQAR
ncbi:hypothetical protein [Streptomyces viridochromogenes]|uniref:Putative Lipoprotein n=1 Tax=Streptomyces viridochromogenes Tue57 TaxID=1160705 RepID=L8PPB9_STRVR|nr:hypothetical protein [Streptomyces viridochromogenes]ELS57257.1 putative Lipoprotein [Streptomyces viridochromogenes Tue57]